MSPHFHRALWSALELICTVGGQAAITPLMLKRLNSEEFSLWVIAQTALVASAAMSWGMGQALFPVLARAEANGERSATRATLMLFVKRTTSTVACLIAVAFVAIASGWRPHSLAQLPPHDLYTLVIGMFIWSGVTEIDNGFSLALKARGRFDLAALLEGSTRAAFFGLTYAFVAEGDTAVVPIVLAILVTLAKSVFKWIVFNAPSSPRIIDSIHTIATAEKVREELRTSGHWIWLSLIGALVFNAVDRWLVGAYLGAQLLAVYATCLQIAQAPHAIVAAIGQPIIAWVAARRARDQDGGLWAPLGIATVLAGLPSAILLIFLEPLMMAWISRDFATNYLNTARYLTLAFLVLSMNVPAYYCLLGLGRMRAAALTIFMASAIYTVGCVALPPSLTMFVAIKFVYPAMTLVLILNLIIVVKGPQR